MAQNEKLIRLRGEITRPADTTAYTAQDAVGGVVTLSVQDADFGSGPAVTAEGSYIVRSVKLYADSKTTTNANFDVILFSSGVTTYPDNGEYGLDYNKKHIEISRNAMVLTTNGTTNSTAASDTNFVEQPFRSLGTSLYAQIVATAAYVPTSGERFFVEVFVQSYD